VDRLLVDSGRVVGVAAGSDEVRAHTVRHRDRRLRGANPDLVKQHYDRTTPAGDWLWYIGAGQLPRRCVRARQANQRSDHRAESRLLLLAPDFGPGLDVYLPGWLVVVNQRGHRFFDEMSPYSTTETVIPGSRTGRCTPSSTMQQSTRLSGPMPLRQRGNNSRGSQTSWNSNG